MYDRYSNKWRSKHGAEESRFGSHHELDEASLAARGSSRKSGVGEGDVGSFKYMDAKPHHRETSSSARGGCAAAHVHRVQVHTCRSHERCIDETIDIHIHVRACIRTSSSSGALMNTHAAPHSYC
jgi:hypothetical protein